MYDFINNQDDEIKMEKKYAVIILCPDDYIHSLGLLEVAETINYGLLNLGIDSILTQELDINDRTQIIIGGHLLHLIKDAKLDPNAIIYNFEQIDSESLWLNNYYINILKSHKVWDYSKKNIELLKNFGVTNVSYVPLGYVSQLCRINIKEKQDIDILFYGSINSRREHILNQLKQCGLNVVTIFGVYGSDRDKLIARSKIVLNIHFYDAKIFEIARISYLLSNGVCVVSESGFSPEEEYFRKSNALILSDYDLIVENCINLLNNSENMTRIRKQGQAYMKTLKQENFLKNVLQDNLDEANYMEKNNGFSITNDYRAPLPTILNMGSGKDWKDEALNIDIQEEWNPDAIFDLNQEIPAEGLILNTKRFGEIKLTENHFDIIYSFDVLEHLTNLSTAMYSCLRLLKIEGLFIINVPYDLSWGAWQDPTHVRAFNERSWLYYTDWFWYFGWSKWRFDLISLQYMLSPIGQEMHNQNIPLDIIARTPRAVDSMQVELKKRLLNDEEILLVKSKLRHD